MGASEIGASAVGMSLPIVFFNFFYCFQTMNFPKKEENVMRAVDVLIGRI